MSIIHAIQLEDNEVLIKKKVKTPTPNYFRVGNGTMNRYKVKSIDLLDEAMNATKAAQWVIKSIKNGIGWENDYDPVVRVVARTDTEKAYLKRGYKELVEKDLVRRVKRGYYMINPDALIPIDYKKAKEIWDASKK